MISDEQLASVRPGRGTGIGIFVGTGGTGVEDEDEDVGIDEVLCVTVMVTVGLGG